MHRFYAESGVTGPNVPLCEEDARHATRVLRMKLGESCEMFVDGKRYAAEISAMGENGVQALLLNELPSTEAKLRITLYQGLPKADKMELIVQKSVELVIATISP